MQLFRGRETSDELGIKKSLTRILNGIETSEGEQRNLFQLFVSLKRVEAKRKLAPCTAVRNGMTLAWNRETALERSGRSAAEGSQD